MLSTHSPPANSTTPAPGRPPSLIDAVRVWADMVKLPHSIFALPFALIATFLAGRQLEHQLPSIGQVALIVVCMVGARSVAMTYNRIVDAAIDARNPRTAMRPLPAGRLSRRAAWGMLAVSALLFLLGCGGFMLFYSNPWPLRLSLPVLVVLCGYSFAKRFTKWSHLWLGLAIGLSPSAAWIAIHPASLGWEALLLSGIVCGWIGGFDILYACQDIDIDRKEGLYSLPSRLGARVALWIARGLHALTAIGLIGLGALAGLGVLYAAGVGVSIVLLIVENALVRPGDYRHINLAFFTINGIISCALAVTTILDIIHGLP